MNLTAKENHINYQRIEHAIRYLQQNFRRQPDLDEVAEQVHLSPFHFHRIFQEWAGISPKRFLQYLTADYLKDRLRQSRSIEEAAADAGLSAQSRVYDLFTTLEAVTPGEYRARGGGLRITYGFHDTPFGRCLIGVTARGICWLSFVTESGEEQSLNEMRSFWHNSDFSEDLYSSSQYVRQVFDRTPGERIHVVVKGTNFQVKVWEALLRIPFGMLTTYQDIAQRVGNPRALQAVGSAVGTNAIAYLIPCHRVIRKDGILSEYRWSPERKKSIIGWELARLSPNNH